MIDLSFVLMNPDLCVSFSVLRTIGQWAASGDFATTNPTTIAMFGSVQQADAETLLQVPEGDRVTGAMVFYVTVPIYTTRDGQTPGLADIATYNGQQYRIQSVEDWSANGFWKAVGTRMQGS